MRRILAKAVPPGKGAYRLGAAFGGGRGDPPNGKKLRPDRCANIMGKSELR
jgi:hypothetical protein